MPSDPSDEVVTDLVEYFIIAVPDRAAISALLPALGEVARRAAIRILDVVVVVKDAAGSTTPLELDDVESRDVVIAAGDGDVGGLLSDHDVALASIAIRPGSAGLIVVTEDRWARPLSVAAQRVGGHIVAGERIPASRVESALADRVGPDETGA
jgi:hypothetical protein